MFDSKQTLTERLADAVDLLIDFATLGEFGLESAARPSASCQARQRQAPAPARFRVPSGDFVSRP